MTSQTSDSAESGFQAKIASDPAKYLRSLDATTRRRIVGKIDELVIDPLNIRTSKPLSNSNKRSARVGAYRILFLIEGNILLISDIGPRNQVYRNA